MESKPQGELTRIAYFEGELTVDLTGRAKGRGVYLCQDAECIDKAEKRRALQRSFRTELSKTALEDVFLQLRGALDNDQK
jgi:predicted RNA-binding protein YlxR (DUF448 family)